MSEKYTPRIDLDDLAVQIYHARATAERLLAAIDAVMKEADDADQQDRLISPDILRKRLADRLTGEADG